MDHCAHLTCIIVVMWFDDAYVGVGKMLGIAFHDSHPIGDAHGGVEGEFQRQDALADNSCCYNFFHFHFIFFCSYYDVIPQEITEENKDIIYIYLKVKRIFCKIFHSEVKQKRFFYNLSFRGREMIEESILYTSGFIALLWMTLFRISLRSEWRIKKDTVLVSFFC